jgi:hypothetical protein
MKKTIHYIGDISYIKDEGHLKEVMNYITRNFQLGRSLTTLNKEKRDVWIQRAKDEKAIRKDSQIALRFHLSLPNDKRDDIEFRNKVIKKLIEMFNIPSHHIDVAFHLDSKENYHMHVLIYPRDKNGKKLRLKKNDLRKIHNEWDNFLKREGYNIKKNGNNKVVKKSIWQYMKEKTEEMGYLPIPSFIIDEEMINEGKKRFLKKLKKLNEEIRDTEISLFEDFIEKEAIKVAENRLIRKMMKTKEYLYSKPLERHLENTKENLNDNRLYIKI